jgi:hypothetical protein
MIFTVTEEIQARMRRFAGKLMRQAAGVPSGFSASLTIFYGTAVSLNLAVPLDRLNLRSLCNDLTEGRREQFGTRSERARLSRQSIADVSLWRCLGPEGRRMQPRRPSWAIHLDATDLGLGQHPESGSVEREEPPKNSACAQGIWDQGIWTAEEQCGTIAFCELRAS